MANLKISQIPTKIASIADNVRLVVYNPAQIGVNLYANALDFLTYIRANHRTDLSAARDQFGVTLSSSTGDAVAITSATSLLAGPMSSADKVKIDGIEAGATADQTGTEIVTKINVELGSTTWQGGGGGGGGTSIVTDLEGTAWRLFHSNADGDVVEIPFGTSGQYLQSAGASAAPAFATPPKMTDPGEDAIPFRDHSADGMDWVAIGAGLSFTGGTLSATGSGTGDMLADTYDPQDIGGDAFARANHTGTQAIASVTGLQTALDGKATAAQGALADSAVQPGDALSGLAEDGSAVKMTPAERTKLTGIASGATANSADADLLDRDNHTGTQAIATVDGLQTALDGKATTAQGSLADSALQPGDAITALDATAWRFFASDGSGNVTEVSFGASGTVLKSNGASSAPSFQAEASGASALADLSDVDDSVGSPSDGDILVYRSSGSDWVLETKPAGGSSPAMADITDVGITSVADNEVLAYDSGSSEWINQTPAEAGLATAAQGALADSAIQSGDLATVATTGAYSDLSGTPTLGTAAASDTGDFATAAQGALADTAVQPAGLSGYALTTYVDSEIAALINSAPGALDTLDELAAALGDDADFAGTVTTALAGKASSAQGALADSAVQPGDALSALAEDGSAVKMTPAERTKLSGVATAATANSADATLLARANHTGTQAIATVDGLQTALDGKIATSAIGSSVQAYDVDTLKADVSTQLRAGFSGDHYNYGNIGSGTLTLNLSSSNYFIVSNTGAHTLDLPVSPLTFTAVVRYSNSSTAGTLSFSSDFDKVHGADQLTTTDGDKFMITIVSVAGTAVATVLAAQ